MASGNSKLQWIFELLDKVSAPARGIAKALEKIGHVFGKSLHVFKEGVHLVHDGIELMKMGWEAVEGIREKVGEILAERRFKDNALIALEALTGSRDAAVELFEKTEAFAGRTGQNVQQLVRQTTELRAAGYGAAEIDLLNQAIADVGIVGGPERAGALAEAIHRIGLEGKLTEHAMRGLKGAGVSTDMLFKELSKTFHVSTDTIKKSLGGKGIEKQAGVFALLETIKKQFTGGKDVGSLVDKSAHTLSGALERVKMIPQLLASATMGLPGEDSPMARFLTNVADTFAPDSPSGRRIIERIKALGEKILAAFGIGGGPGLFSDLAGPGGVKKIETIFNNIADTIERVIPKVEAFASAMGKIASAFAWVGGKFVQAGENIGTAAGVAAYGPGAALQPGIDAAKHQLYMQRDQRAALLFAENRDPRTSRDKIAANVAELNKMGMNVTVNVDARGATKDTADHIARKVAQETASSVTHAQTAGSAERGL